MQIPRMLREDHSRRLMYCILIFLFALGLRLVYTNNVLDQFAGLSATDQTSYEKGYFTLDSSGYLDLARELTNGHMARAVSLTRPIGYPAFIAVLGCNPAAVLRVQALLLSLIPVCAFLLVTAMTKGNLLGVVAGLVLSISPSGIALGSLIMSDALLASLFAVMVVALVFGALRNSVGWVLFSAVVSGLAILVKPILLFWPVVGVMFFALVTAFNDGSPKGLRRWFPIDKGRRTQMLMLFFIPLVFMISWAEVNYRENGMFTVSIIGNVTMREYVAARAEEWGMAGRSPSWAAIIKNQSDSTKRLEAMPLQERVDANLAESIAIFKKYPTPTLRAFAEDAREIAEGGWDYFPRQLPFSQAKLGRLFAKISSLESLFRKQLLVMMFLAPFICVLALRRNSSQYACRLASMIFAMTLTFLYFLALSGMTFWTGPRIVYPAEILVISTAAMLLALLIHSFQNASADQKSLRL